jgi:hypothetical protein
MRARDNLLLKLVGEDEPMFTSKLLYHLISEHKEVRDNLLELILGCADIPEHRRRDKNYVTIFTTDRESSLRLGRRIAPLGLHMKNRLDSVSIGINVISAEPLSTIRPYPTDVVCHHPISVFFTPEWRFDAVEHVFQHLKGAEVLILPLDWLVQVIDRTFHTDSDNHLALMIIGYLGRRDEVYVEEELPNWLLFTMEKSGSPAHWSLLKKLRTCFHDSDLQLTQRPRFLGFSFRHGSQRGWLAFHEFPTIMPSGRNVGLVLSLPHRIIPGNQKLKPAKIPENFFGGDKEYRHWEIQYELDWTTYEPWVKSLSGLIT